MTDFPWKPDARGNTSAGAYASANAYANANANASANANANANANASLSFRPLSTAIRLQERAVWSIGVRRPDPPRRDLGAWVISRPSNF